MCLNLINSQYRNISEVETLLNSKILKLTENDIINMKNNRDEIEHQLEIEQEYQDVIRLL